MKPVVQISLAIRLRDMPILRLMANQNRLCTRYAVELLWRYPSLPSQPNQNYEVSCCDSWRTWSLDFNLLYAPSSSVVVEPDDVVVVSKAQLLPNPLWDLGSPSAVNLRDNLVLPIHACRTCPSDGANYEATYQSSSLRFHVDFTAQRKNAIDV